MNGRKLRRHAGALIIIFMAHCHHQHHNLSPLFHVSVTTLNLPHGRLRIVLTILYNSNLFFALRECAIDPMRFDLRLVSLLTIIIVMSYLAEY